MTSFYRPPVKVRGLRLTPYLKSLASKNYSLSWWAVVLTQIKAEGVTNTSRRAKEIIKHHEQATKDRWPRYHSRHKP